MKKYNKKSQCKCVVKDHTKERCARIDLMLTFKREVQKTANVFDTCHDSEDSDDDAEKIHKDVDDSDDDTDVSMPELFYGNYFEEENDSQATDDDMPALLKRVHREVLEDVHRDMDEGSEKTEDDMPELLPRVQTVIDSASSSDDSMPDLVTRPPCDSSSDDYSLYQGERYPDWEVMGELDTESYQVLGIQTEKSSNKGILLDSGAAVHCGSSDEKMADIREPKTNNVQVASGNNLPVKKVGTVYLEDKNSKAVMCLKDYHQAPGLTKEMISLGKLIEDGWKPEFSNTGNIDLRKGKDKFTCKRDTQDGMFYVQGQRVLWKSKPQVSPVTINTGKPEEWHETTVPLDDEGNTIQKIMKLQKMDINEAHDKMGHKGEVLIKKTAKMIGCKLSGTLISCEGCAMAKAKQRAVSKTTNIKADKPGKVLFLICQDHLWRHLLGTNT